MHGSCLDELTLLWSSFSIAIPFFPDTTPQLQDHCHGYIQESRRTLEGELVANSVSFYIG